ncbi:MAG: undecaprenyldiphospho-muramoylpentapeptide beta-N-acetylglucosaminyltransferase [Proteobacteria bacterium]|nr:undecaprenyldiphospho-muramoylpentapeptide beta-N-acetylglucosaminyltransferase [Pseudomonadota bacterium]
MKKKKVVITGGGTGGHVFPALAIAEELRKRKFSVLYVGTEHGMESKFVPEKGFPFYTVSTGALKNQSILKRISSLFHLFKGVLWSLGFLIKEKPSLTIGVGGYVSAPVCLASFILRIPIFLQEQNASVGIANQLLGKLATKVFLGFKEAEYAFNPKKCIVSGNPLREVFMSSPASTFNPQSLHLLVLGGSQGAKAVNQAMLDLAADLVARFPGIQVTHQTGQSDAARVAEGYDKIAKSQFRVLPFIKDMVEAYNQASLVICRAGALTVSELIQMGRPAIFVPYPRRGQNDQTANARFVAEAGAAKVVEQGPQFKERLWAALESSFNPVTLQEMAEKTSRLRSSSGLATIGDQCEIALR